MELFTFFFFAKLFIIQGTAAKLLWMQQTVHHIRHLFIL